MPRISLRLHVGVAFVAMCSSHANGFHLDRSTSGVGLSDDGAVRAGARIEIIPQEHSASRRDIFDQINCAIGFGAVSTLLCTINSPCFAEEGLESDTGQPNSMNSAGIASNTPGSESISAVECDEECKEQRRRRIEERRAMMRQSRSTSSRREVFELSKQRARLYGSDYKGTNCIDGVPCI